MHNLTRPLGSNGAQTSVHTVARSAVQQFNSSQTLSDSLPEKAKQERVEREWGQIPVAIETFGIRRTKFYELISKNKIKSICIRERGRARGTRLINFDSVRTYLESLAAEASN